MIMTSCVFSPRRLRYSALRPLLWFWLLFVLASGMQSAGAAMASGGDEAQAAAQRPKIGLVLAGGGAKGAAHVGVLKVLEAMRIPIDYIAGTSMGSIVGGLYASGMRPEDIEQVIQHIDWEDIFVDNPNREDRSFRRKTDDLLYPVKAKPGFNEGKIVLPLAFVHGQKFDLELNRLTQRVAHIKDFDQLPIPYRAIATDLETGQEVILKSGSLPMAIRASLAVPGAFDPVEIDGRLLVDGGLANNVPVSVARAMGADVVIVSDLGSTLYTREQMKTGLDVGVQMVNFLFALNSIEQLKSLGSQDVLISSKLGDIGAGSFDRITEAIPIGEAAARKAADSLGRYSLGDADYRQHVARRLKPDADTPVVHFVRINNQSEVGDDLIASYIPAKAGAPLDVDALERGIQQLYGLDIFESVRYEVVTEGGKDGLVLHAKEKPWGPGYLQLGMITSSDFQGDAAFRLGVLYTRTEINALNGEWRLGGQIGDEPALITEIFQPLDPAARYFAFGNAGYRTRNTYIYDTDEHRTTKYSSDILGLSLGLGRQFGTWGEFRLGYQWQSGDRQVSVGAPEPDDDFTLAEFYLRMTADKLDSLYFPTKGYYGVAEWRIADEALGSDSDYQQVRLNYTHAYSWGRNTLVGGIGLNTTPDDDAPVESLYRLGGFLRLSGYELDQLSGQHMGLARVIYLRSLNDFSLAKAYLGGSLEWGNVWQDSGDIGLDDTIFAGSLFIGVDSVIGPIYLGYGRNDEGEGSVYLYLGPLFSF